MTTPVPCRLKSTHAQRLALSQKILKGYPDRVPILVEAGPNAPPIARSKFLVPCDIDAAKFIYEIRKHIRLHAAEAIFVFVGDPDGTMIMPQPSQTMSLIYQQHKQSDGFLYVRYALENTFGAKLITDTLRSTES